MKAKWVFVKIAINFKVSINCNPKKSVLALQAAARNLFYHLQLSLVHLNEYQIFT